jgi:predicted PurR-regulated permease PerM/methylmalonyl-CoA mutase cobalamin-binding subunit
MSDLRSPATGGPTVEVRAEPPSAFHLTVIGAIIVAALYFGQSVFVPLALAILLSFALAPLALLLRRWHFGRVPSVLAAVVVGVLLISGIAGVIGTQLAHLAQDLPRYQTNIAEKIHSLRSGAAENGIVERASSMLKDLGNEIAKPGAGGDGTAAVAPAGKAPAPIPVEIHEPEPGPIELIERIAGPLLEPLATAGIVLVFVIFILLQREDLRDRFISLAGSHDLQRTTRALDDGAHRLSRYLLFQTAINASFGVLIGAGLWIIGVPNPVLWGVIAMVLRFVPYIGAPIAAAFPALLALAVDPGWSMMIWTIGLFVVIEPIVGQAVEPLLYGHSTGLSTIAVVVAATFWTVLWGPIGLLLSTPLTMCLVVLGRHVENLEFLDVLLGDRPPLALEESLYQRMLARDPDEAAEQAEEILKERSLVGFYGGVVLQALALAQTDVNRGTLDPERRRSIRDMVEGLIVDLADHEDVEPDGEERAGAPPVLETDSLAPEWRERPVLCVAGRGPLDEAAGLLLAQLLERHGIGARLVPAEAASPSNLFQLAPAGVQVVFVSYLDARSLTNARYLVRRLRRRMPDAKVIVAFWTMTPEQAEQRDVLAATGADEIATSLRGALQAIIDMARRAAEKRPASETEAA